MFDFNQQLSDQGRFTQKLLLSSALSDTQVKLDRIKDEIREMRDRIDESRARLQQSSDEFGERMALFRLEQLHPEMGLFGIARFNENAAELVDDASLDAGFAVLSSLAIPGPGLEPEDLRPPRLGADASAKAEAMGLDHLAAHLSATKFAVDQAQPAADGVSAIRDIPGMRSNAPTSAPHLGGVLGLMGSEPNPFGLNGNYNLSYSYSNVGGTIIIYKIKIIYIRR